MKDQDNELFPQRQPGPMPDLLGARVEQFYALEASELISQWGEDKSTLWAEQLSVSAPDTKVLMRYGKSNGWLDDQHAAVTRKVGKGRITYIDVDWQRSSRQ
jgi:beta-galactosidase